MNSPRDTRRHLVILGSGFASFRLLKQIDLRHYRVTVISRRNHFLFTPLLPSTTVGTIEFRSIIEPIRASRTGIEFHLGSAETLDLEQRLLHCVSVDGAVRWSTPFDLLALGVGAENNTYGIPGVREHACFLKELSDARLIRERVIGNLEQASLPGISAEERRRLLHFVAVGAGPTGVRFAAELYDLLSADLKRSYPHLSADVCVTVLEAGKTILSAFDEPLRDYTMQHFRRKKIVIRTENPVREIGPGYLKLQTGEVIPAGVILWATGFAPSAFVAGLPFEKDRAGRLVTDPYLQISGQEQLFAFGDCGCPRGQNLPQLAQVAEQQGHYLGKLLNRRARGVPSAPFRWHNLGLHSYIGQREAVAQFEKGSHISGFWAYQMWRSALLTQLVSLKNKILVPLSWLKTLVFGRDLSKF